VKVAIIDPLYLCLMGGADRASANNLYEVGPVLFKAAKACLLAGATPVFLHHATKSAKKNAEPLDLEDLAWAGIGEFARQWLLLNRREPFAWHRPPRLEPGDRRQCRALGNLVVGRQRRRCQNRPPLGG